MSNITTGYAIKIVDSQRYYNEDDGDFTPRYADNVFWLATIFESIEEAEECIEANELDDNEELEIVQLEKQFNILSRFKRVKQVTHEVIGD